LGVTRDTDAALNAVASADAARLDAVLVRDSLWARLWPHIRTEPVFDALADNERRRFSALAEAASRRDTTLPRHFTDHPVLRQAIAIVTAHRLLSTAFGRAVEAVGPIRASAELDIFGDHTLYEVLVILHAARPPWRTVSELPALESQVGLPSPALLTRPCFEVAWETAAFIDPVKVLPFMHWCMKRWDTLPTLLEISHLGTKIGIITHWGRWIEPAGSEWFSLSRSGLKRVVVRRSRHLRDMGEKVSQTITLDGVEYEHVCPGLFCELPRIFTRAGGPERLTVWPVRPGQTDFATDAIRADYGALWAAGLIDMPLLTCPKEWELT
ncbi:MAG: hypothetical protein QOH57_543, partial [Mycobacterium sp.]|nr:hypothetical protein [Mycobacterium sp.]